MGNDRHFHQWYLLLIPHGLDLAWCLGTLRDGVAAAVNQIRETLARQFDST